MIGWKQMNSKKKEEAGGGGNKSKTLSPLDSNSNNWVQESKVYGGIFRWKS